MNGIRHKPTTLNHLLITLIVNYGVDCKFAINKFKKIRMKLRMGWAGHVARIGRRGYWWECQKEGGGDDIKTILDRMGWCGLD
jgi:hypothetical protein